MHRAPESATGGEPAQKTWARTRAATACRAVIASVYSSSTRQVKHSSRAGLNEPGAGFSHSQHTISPSRKRYGERYGLLGFSGLHGGLNFFTPFLRSDSPGYTLHGFF